MDSSNQECPFRARAWQKSEIASGPSAIGSRGRHQEPPVAIAVSLPSESMSILDSDELEPCVLDP